mmetsp:Transcript_36771/g.97928  ORF Transcript_36771/g.97928 Transcript_36771/m.97928 type:complete len:170 (-) Transcript_36771:376-885(-)
MFLLLLALVSTHSALATTNGKLLLYKRHDMCLDLPGGSSDDGVQLWMWSCNGRPNQMWYWADDGTIKGSSGKCLDLPGNNPEGAPVLWQWDCNGSDQQKWGFGPYPLSTVHGGVVFPQYYGWSYCMDLLGGEPAYVGQKVILWPCSSQANDGELWIPGVSRDAVNLTQV